MNLKDFKNYRCKCCKQCKGSEFHQSHCTIIDEIDGAWEMCEQETIENPSYLLSLKFSKLLTKYFNLKRTLGNDHVDTEAAFTDCAEYEDFVKRFFGINVGEYYEKGFK